MRPDKTKVVDEVWDEARIESFLHKAPLGEERSSDYSALLYAYRSMRPDDFAAFVRMFVQAGRDVNATSNGGETLLATIRDHRHGARFRTILEEAGGIAS
ncbi:MAG: hypothetical protein GWM88_13130 [Pseudomonadales bacterium]|nr:hypothetical protein [Pseudomonadales bacterium]NIX08890.1 hypothetical protein [Pseudomonadales bacterium]